MGSTRALCAVTEPHHCWVAAAWGEVLQVEGCDGSIQTLQEGAAGQGLPWWGAMCQMSGYPLWVGNTLGEGCMARGWRDVCDGVTMADWPGLVKGSRADWNPIFPTNLGDLCGATWKGKRAQALWGIEQTSVSLYDQFLTELGPLAEECSQTNRQGLLQWMLVLAAPRSCWVRDLFYTEN